MEAEFKSLATEAAARGMCEERCALLVDPAQSVYTIQARRHRRTCRDRLQSEQEQASIPPTKRDAAAAATRDPHPGSLTIRKR